jgi:hypothetical protein
MDTSHSLSSNKISAGSNMRYSQEDLDDDDVSESEGKGSGHDEQEEYTITPRSNDSSTSNNSEDQAQQDQLRGEATSSNSIRSTSVLQDVGNTYAQMQSPGRHKRAWMGQEQQQDWAAENLGSPHRHQSHSAHTRHHQQQHRDALTTATRGQAAWGVHTEVGAALHADKDTAAVIQQLSSQVRLVLLIVQTKVQTVQSHCPVDKSPLGCLPLLEQHNPVHQCVSQAHTLMFL